MRRTSNGIIGRARKFSPNRLGDEIPRIAADELRFLGLPHEDGEKINSIITRAARRAGLDYWRAFDIYYVKARKLTSEEVEQIAAAAEEKRLEAIRNEAHELRVRIERMEARLAQTDPDFHRENISALRHALRGRG